MLKYQIVFLLTFLFCLPSVHSEVNYSQDIYSYDISFEITDKDILYFKHGEKTEFLKPVGSIIQSYLFPFILYPNEDVELHCNNEMLEYSSRRSLNNKYNIIESGSGGSVVNFGYDSIEDKQEYYCELQVKFRDAVFFDSVDHL